MMRIKSNKKLHTTYDIDAVYIFKMQFLYLADKQNNNKSVFKKDKINLNKLLSNFKKSYISEKDKMCDFDKLPKVDLTNISIDTLSKSYLRMLQSYSPISSKRAVRMIDTMFNLTNSHGCYNINNENQLNGIKKKLLIIMNKLKYSTISVESELKKLFNIAEISFNNFSQECHSSFTKYFPKINKCIKKSFSVHAKSNISRVYGYYHAGECNNEEFNRVYIGENDKNRMLGTYIHEVMHHAIQDCKSDVPSIKNSIKFLLNSKIKDSTIYTKLAELCDRTKNSIAKEYLISLDAQVLKDRYLYKDGHIQEEQIVRLTQFISLLISQFSQDKYAKKYLNLCQDLSNIVDKLLSKSLVKHSPNLWLESHDKIHKIIDKMLKLIPQRIDVEQCINGYSESKLISDKKLEDDSLHSQNKLESCSKVHNVIHSKKSFTDVYKQNSNIKNYNLKNNKISSIYHR